MKPRNDRNNQRDRGPRINDRIFAKTVQVIDDSGVNLGAMSITDALNKAASTGLDLVEINDKAVPVITKIMDYGKYKYEQQKRLREQRRNQKTTELKEVWIKPFIEDNDLHIKMKKVFEFLEDGDKVKVSVMTRGSRMVLARGREVVPELFARVIEVIGDKGVLESRSRPDERTKSIIVAPTAKKEAAK